MFHHCLSGAKPRSSSCNRLPSNANATQASKDDGKKLQVEQTGAKDPLTIPHYGQYTIYQAKTGSTKANYSSFIPHENSVKAVTIIKRAVIVHATSCYHCLRLILQLASGGVIRRGNYNSLFVIKYYLINMDISCSML